MYANLVLALLSKHPHLMYTELAVVTPISPSIANLSYIPKAASIPFSYLVIDIVRIWNDWGCKVGHVVGTHVTTNSVLSFTSVVT
ncbi:Bgt-50875 [Blumeria graminis f. sp. tritici]|uniref:Bgt-50875 n=1 Tax=Blumeria graminis f. sp. tritici TaxID=62690 RepID=A0A9X9MPM9_BLUGR|nr:Bgt-50875 [Blumeria graminis f. sp. tritici]